MQYDLEKKQLEKKKKRKKRLALYREEKSLTLVYSELKVLTPKGPDCVFWLYSDFGQVPTTRNFHILS